MKVLFAVNSESISDAIIKKYQKDYREILSYKNVYYFNAIQKEIQKDKSYDRIVISADLEPFSNNNYESIDKFIFEKLDGVSDEAHDTRGNEISIIFICSDRHTKGSSFLVKLFGLGIYNALLGNDRSMEEVCRLINKPRTKKEAKIYYKIDTDDVNYRAESEDEVDELQIQNILYHFRKLGKNTDKYAGSFENIATQYTDEQLKIIINCLPANVKRVLEQTSAKYQQIMTANGMMVQGIKSSTISDKEDQKRTGLKIDIIENKLSQTKMNGPIVIPNAIKAKGSGDAKKVVAVPQKAQLGERATSSTLHERQIAQLDKTVKMNGEESQNQPKVQAVGKDEKLIRLPNGKVVKKKIMPESMAQSNNMNVQPKVVKPMRKVAETTENNTMKHDMFSEKMSELEDFSTETEINEGVNEESKNMEPPKKRRGRPRTKPIEEPKPKGKRGRPRKNPVEVKEVKPIVEEKQVLDLEEELPDLETITDKSFDFTSFENEDFLSDTNDNKIDGGFEDFLVEDEPILEQENGVEELEEIQLPELDELDDINQLDEDDEFSEVLEESFDEFNDYDEYGQYEASAKIKPEEDIDKLYQEDILAEENDDLPGLEEISTLESNDFDEIGNDNFETNFDQEEGNTLLSELEDEEDILSAVDYEEEGLDLEEDNLVGSENFMDMPAFEENDHDVESYTQPDSTMETGALESIQSPIDYSMSNLNSLMAKDKKIVTFLGSPKNGVSFLVNNLAEIFASVGINTAILDMTKNRNSYYIYTQNEESLRQIAYTSIEKLQNGVASGIRVKQNLTVYTALPNDGKDYSNVEAILSTLVQNHSLVLIDCDFETNPAYFASCQEIYLVQSMDILTIQPLTAFLKDLKIQGVFEPEKVRVVINKELKVRGLNNKLIIGGMSSYNDPAMSFMTELFDKEVKYCSIPFEEMAYSKYLEGMLNCKVSISGYSKNFMNRLRVLGDMVYPLTSRQTYSSNSKQNYKQNNFSNSMNDTLKKMKKNY